MNSIENCFQKIKRAIQLKWDAIYNQFIAETDDKPHVVQLKRIILLLHVALKFVGTSIIGEFKYIKMSYFVIFLLVVELVFLLHTANSVLNDLSTVMQCLTVFGFYISCAFKIYVTYIYNKTLVSLFTFSVHVYNSNTTPNRIKVLQLQVKRNKSVLLKLIYCYILRTTLFGLSGAYSIFCLKELPFPMYIPFVDHTTSEGFIATLGNIGMIFPLIIVGNLGYIAVYALRYKLRYIAVLAALKWTFLNGPSVYAQIVLLFCDLVELIEDSMRQLSASKGKARSYLIINTIIQITDGLRYTKFVREFFDNPILLQVGSSYVACTIAMFLLIAYKWYFGLVAIVYFMVEIYAPCYCGHFIYDSNKRLQSIIYSTDWYNFSVKEQQIILNLIHMVQNGTVLWIGFFAELRIESGFALTKNMYTYTMLLLDMLSH